MKKILLPLMLLTQPALALEEALTTCRQIEEITERVACYDEIVDTSFGVEKTATPEVAKTSDGPDAQSLFGTNDAEAKRIIETSFAIEQISQIEAIVTNVRQSATRKLTVLLDNGQVWRQLDNKPLRIKSGEAVIIRKASLGSYLMEKKSGSRGIRVKRAN